MSDHTPSLDEVLSEALMEVYDNGTNPNALREARAVIARVGESAWAEAVRAEALREFAHSIPGDVHDPRHVADLARGVADHIEKEAGLK